MPHVSSDAELARFVRVLSQPRLAVNALRSKTGRPGRPPMAGCDVSSDGGGEHECAGAQERKEQGAFFHFMPYHQTKGMPL